MVTAAPELSVVIVTFRCRDLVLDCLADLEAARSTVTLEVFVVDNASGDGTVEAIATRFPWVNVEALGENVGFGRANNRAIQRANGPTILVLNPDTRVTPVAMRECLDELQRRPDVGVLSPRVVDGQGRFDLRCKRGFPTLWGTFTHVARLDRVLRDRRSLRYTMRWLPEVSPSDVEAVSGAVMFVRADALQLTGGFDERFFMYGEDIDLCVRIAGLGWRVRYWPEVTVTHLGRGSGWTTESRQAWARAIGDLHRIHRTSQAGAVSGAVCHLAGTTLGALDALGDSLPHGRRHGRSA